MIARGPNAERWLGTFLPSREDARRTPELAEMRRRAIDEPIEAMDARRVATPQTAKGYPQGADTTATTVEEVCAAGETSPALEARTGPSMKAPGGVASTRGKRRGGARPRPSWPAAEEGEQAPGAAIAWMRAFVDAWATSPDGALRGPSQR